jgi:hypothetical protein
MMEPFQERLMINHGIFLLFAIPALCIVVVAIAQFGDEMFKKKFIIDRRKAQDENSRFRRRYSDSQLRALDSKLEHSDSTDTSDMETSGNRR